MDKIDPLIFSFYIKNDMFYSHYAVKASKGISVFTWENFQDVLNENLGDASTTKTFLKQNVQSPGFISTLLPIEHMATMLNAMTPYAVTAFGAFGVSKLQIKYGEYDLKGPLPWFYYRKQIKENIAEDTKAKTLDNQKKNWN
ncbi:hypothetical protein [Viridibacillus arvi]|uniref:Uncharacterized protein n=1 Tax=Viridibacillus arvi TaxID=263475 RepID=A0A0M0LMC1_9BACL|nr:hypothetical protein [Viridibacillus arvi]KOO52037.1 hypothetical protein AMD00_06360 [Viridibacillus arvi]